MAPVVVFLSRPNTLFLAGKHWGSPVHSRNHHEHPSNLDSRGFQRQTQSLSSRAASHPKSNKHCPSDAPQFSGGLIGSRGVLRADESAIYLRSIGAPFGVRGLLSDIVILNQGFRVLLPLRDLLHPAVIATVAMTCLSISACRG